MIGDIGIRELPDLRWIRPYKKLKGLQELMKINKNLRGTRLLDKVFFCIEPMFIFFVSEIAVKDMRILE